LDAEALRYVSEVYFEQTKGAFAAYSRLNITGGTIDRLQGSIAKKGESLVQLKSAADVVLNTKDSYWGVATLYMLGVAHEGFASMFENPPGIKGAKVKDLKERLARDEKALRTEGMNY